MSNRRGHLFIVGGAEDREDDKEVLERYVEFCGGSGASIAVITAASSIPDQVWETYDTAFRDLGVRRQFHVDATTPEEAGNADLAGRVLDADGVFMTGGDQRRLVAIIRGSAIHDAMRQGFRAHGTCIGGTSAGASAMASLMLARGTRDKLPDSKTAQLEPGLGFLTCVAIDQHFSERQRLARLLSAIAQEPSRIGVGIDEDTALVISNDGCVEVVGSGAVTVVDGRHMSSNIGEVGREDYLELVNVILHLLPAHSRYDPSGTACDEDSRPIPPSLKDVLTLMSKVQP